MQTFVQFAHGVLVDATDFTKRMPDPAPSFNPPVEDMVANPVNAESQPSGATEVATGTEVAQTAPEAKGDTAPAAETAPADAADAAPVDVAKK